MSRAPVEPTELKRMAAAIAHRGPDEEGFFLDGPVGFGCRRLSIIDVEHGHIPLSNEDGTIWITYNGEIYNYRALKRELEQAGHVFRTSSDTEVVVHLYEELGERCVERLRGMFAFAIWDAPQKKLFLARDRIGQKPLFYAESGDAFLFASEIKAILAAGGVSREMDHEAMHDYLSLRFIAPPRTMLRQVRKLPPAHTLVYQDGRARLARYWDLDFRAKSERPEEELLGRLEEVLTDTVKAHLISDVPVGAFLSGGMDSSMVVAMMARAAATPFSTFAVGVNEEDFDELPYARLVARRYQTRHVEVRVESNLIQLLPRMVWHLDEPSDPIAACMYHAAALAARHVKVVLGGDGGDELFAGFDRYLGFLHLHRYGLIPEVVRARLLQPAIEALPDSFSYKSLTQKLRWINQLSSLPAGGHRYAEATSFFRFSHEQKRALYADGLWQTLGDRRSGDVIADAFAQAPADDVVDRMLYADFVTRLPEHSLMLTDRMTMAHGVEARSPFLDHELVEFMATFPSRLKIRGRTLKYALRKLARGYLPEAIVARQKHGFMFPIAYWFEHELGGFVNRYLMDSYFVRAGIFSGNTVTKLVAEHRSGRVDNHVRLWMLLNLTLWHQLYVEQCDLEDVTATLQEYHERE